MKGGDMDMFSYEPLLYDGDKASTKQQTTGSRRRRRRSRAQDT